MVKNGENEYLAGEFESSLISGHRITVPTKLRKILGKKLVLSKGYEGCLIIVSQQKWEELVKPLTQKSFLDRNLRETLRFLVGSSHQISLDAQGRFVVPPVLREYAHLSFTDTKSDSAIFVGLVNWIEIWSKDQWTQQSQHLEQNADAIAQELITES